MNRRDLLKGAVTLPIIGTSVLAGSSSAAVPKMKIIKPKRLSPGDTVAVIAPSSAVAPEAFDRALANLESLGFKTKVGKYARGSRGFLSGTDAERLHDLHGAFGDGENKGVWCVRGGSGAPRLLPNIDYELIRKNPKIFIGFSDITALHIAIHQHTGLVTFHGPVGTSEYSDYTRAQVLNVLTKPVRNYKISVAGGIVPKDPKSPEPLVIVPGKSRGRLTGGNLSLLGALAGTPFAIKQLKGALIFIEDINEPPYKVDRLLTQLRQSTDIEQVAGVALGTFTSGEAENEASANLLKSVIQDRLGGMGVPVIYGLSFGHIRNNCTLPYGVRAELDTADASITFLESAVR